MKPTLTRPRWYALWKLDGAGERPFIGADYDVKGPTLVSLEKCGWVERVEAPANDAPFAIATQGHHWRLTDLGRAAVKALPATQPRRA